MDRWEKVTLQNCGRALVKPKNQPGGTCGLLKEAATLDIASPDTCQCLNPPFKPFTSP